MHSQCVTVNFGVFRKILHKLALGSDINSVGFQFAQSVSYRCNIQLFPTLFNCVTALVANSVSLKYLFYRCDSLYIQTISNSRLHSTSEEISLAACVQLCS
jgi:hypothetical protein